MCNKRGITPQYDLIASEGAVHEPLFVFKVTAGEYIGTGKGLRCSQAFNFAHSLLMIVVALSLSQSYIDALITCAHNFSTALHESKTGLSSCWLLAGRTSNLWKNSTPAIPKCSSFEDRLVTGFDQEWLWKNELVKPQKDKAGNSRIRVLEMTHYVCFVLYCM